MVWLVNSCKKWEAEMIGLLPAGPASKPMLLPLFANKILVGSGDTVLLVYDQGCPGARVHGANERMVFVGWETEKIALNAVKMPADGTRMISPHADFDKSRRDALANVALVEPFPPLHIRRELPLVLTTKRHGMSLVMVAQPSSSSPAASRAR